MSLVRLRTHIYPSLYKFVFLQTFYTYIDISSPVSLEDVRKETVAEKMLNFTWCRYNSLLESNLLLQGVMAVTDTRNVACDLNTDSAIKWVSFHGETILGQSLFIWSPAAFFWSVVKLLANAYGNRLALVPCQITFSVVTFSVLFKNYNYDYYDAKVCSCIKQDNWTLQL